MSINLICSNCSKTRRLRLKKCSCGSTIARYKVRVKTSCGWLSKQVPTLNLAKKVQLKFQSQSILEGIGVHKAPNGTEYKGRPMIHLYEIFLEFNDIEHRHTKVGNPKTNGFVERFNRTVLDEFFPSAFRKKLYETVESLQLDLDKWLHHYANGFPP